MKVIAYSKTDMKVSLSDTYKKMNAILEERKKFPDRYPKQLSPFYSVGSSGGITIYDATEEQLANLTAYWTPEVSYKFVVLFEGTTYQDALKRIGRAK